MHLPRPPGDGRILGSRTGGSRRRPFFLSAAYAIGMALTTGPLADKLQIFGLNYRESREKVAQAVRSRGIRCTVLLDERGRAARSYRVVGIPTYILIDRRGNIAWRKHLLPGDLATLLES